MPEGTSIRTSHECAVPGCERLIALDRLMCLQHWARLPLRLKRDVWGTYRKGQELDGEISREYLDAVNAAVAYITSGGWR